MQGRGVDCATSFFAEGRSHREGKQRNSLKLRTICWRENRHFAKMAHFAPCANASDSLIHKLLTIGVNCGARSRLLPDPLFKDFPFTFSCLEKFFAGFDAAVMSWNCRWLTHSIESRLLQSMRIIDRQVVCAPRKPQDSIARGVNKKT